MGTYVQGSTVASKTIENDDDVGLDSAAGGVPSVAFTSFGTGPALTSLKGGGGHFRMVVTSGSGTPAAANNNIQVTVSRPPRKVFIAALGALTPRWYLGSISGSVINIGTGVAAVASTAYEFELIVLF